MCEKIPKIALMSLQMKLLKNISTMLLKNMATNLPTIVYIYMGCVSTVKWQIAHQQQSIQYEYPNHLSSLTTHRAALNEKWIRKNNSKKIIKHIQYKL
jgi:hypothetical protein